jgi:aryl-alcohol dehydrogenase-like predicted oxidoreductase
MRALDDQVRLGKVRYLGISDTPVWVVAQMQTLAADRGWSTFAGLQIEYSIADFIHGGMSDQLDLPPGRSAHG